MIEKGRDPEREVCEHNENNRRNKRQREEKRYAYNDNDKGRKGDRNKGYGHNQTT